MDYTARKLADLLFLILFMFICYRMILFWSFFQLLIGRCSALELILFLAKHSSVSLFHFVSPPLFKACLSEGAKDECNIVEVVGRDYQNKEVAVPVANLKLSCQPWVKWSFGNVDVLKKISVQWLRDVDLKDLIRKGKLSALPNTIGNTWDSLSDMLQRLRCTSRFFRACLLWFL